MADVRLPNGTVVKNVPDNYSQEQLKKMLISSGRMVEADFQIPTPSAPVSPMAAQEPQEEEEEIGAASGMLRSAAQGLTVGASDEIIAGVGAAYESLFNDDRPYNEIYDEILEEERGRLTQFEEESPVLSAGAEITGAILSPVTKLTSAIKVAKLGAMGNTAVQAGAIGVPYAFLSADGDVTDRAENAAYAAVEAPLFGVVGQKFINFSKPVAQKVWGGVTKGTKRLPNTTEGLRKAKDNAYKLVDESEVPFTSSALKKKLIETRRKVVEEGKYVGPEDKEATKVFKLYQGLVDRARKQNGVVRLKDIDNLQRNMWDRYNDAKGAEKKVVLDAINSLDDLLLNTENTSEVMKAAKLTAKRLKKAEYFDRVKKEIDIDSAGKDIDQLSRYKQAVRKVLKDPKQSRFYEPEEIATLTKFLESEGTLTNKFLKKIGKYSPSGQLMAILHAGAAGATGGVSAIASGVALGAKQLATKGSEKLGPALVEQIKGNVPTAAVSSPATAATGASLTSMLLDAKDRQNARTSGM